ncbi:MAG: hypothetical protein E7184_00155 [Erysipelotrichaceae bacterium]|nr:hypothetical protein [Erysipelotrichaceae bacterium]
MQNKKLLKVKRIFNKDERNNYFVIIEKEVRTIKANDTEELRFLLNKKEISEEEYNNCEKLFYTGELELYSGGSLQ